MPQRTRSIDDDAVSTYSALTFNESGRDSEDGRSDASNMETLVIRVAIHSRL